MAAAGLGVAFLSAAGAAAIALNVGSGTAAAAQAQSPQAPDYAVIIRGGTVFDGTRTGRRLADVAIKGDRIVEVGTISVSATAAQVIDARGRYVTPGFIDPHSHAAPAIGTAKLAAAVPILYQGITTVMINPDGGGLADLRPQISDIQRHTPGVNVIPMIGHNGVRREVMGLVNRRPTIAEHARMEGLVKAAMDQGAFGFSSGPFFVPGKYSRTDEIVRLAKVAARYPDAFHISHIRDESSYDVGVLRAIGELIQVSREAKLPGIITHVKMLGPSVWGQSAEAITMINSARAEGLQIYADQYPYAASASELQTALLPGWAQEGGQEAITRRLQNPEQRALIRKEMAQNMARRAGPNAMLMRNYDADPSLEGMRLDEIAKRRLQDPLDTAMDMLIKGGANIVSFNMNEKDVEALMKQPWMMTCTDGSLGEFGDGGEHPRAYGAFPRKIRRYVLERKAISMAQAIHSSTGLTAEVFGIKDRGFIRPGAYADVIVFNPATIRDVATYEKPHAYSVGMDYVFVNGRAAVDHGKVVPQRFGRVLLRGR